MMKLNVFIVVKLIMIWHNALLAMVHQMMLFVILVLPIRLLRMEENYVLVTMKMVALHYIERYTEN